MKGDSVAHRFALAEHEAGGTAHGPLLTELSRLINYTDGRFNTAHDGKYWGKRPEQIQPSEDLFTL